MTQSAPFFVDFETIKGTNANVITMLFSQTHWFPAIKLEDDWFLIACDLNASPIATSHGLIAWWLGVATVMQCLFRLKWIYYVYKLNFSSDIIFSFTTPISKIFSINYIACHQIYFRKCLLGVVDTSFQCILLWVHASIPDLPFHTLSRCRKDCNFSSITQGSSRVASLEMAHDFDKRNSFELKEIMQACFVLNIRSLGFWCIKSREFHSKKLKRRIE